MLKYRFKASKYSVSTDTIACVGKNLLNYHQLSISIAICPIQSLLSVKICLYIRWFYQALNELICL
jgi:hypothetical protein